LRGVFDVFHKNPSHQRRILSDAKNLPMRSNISRGRDTLVLDVSPVFDRARNHIGAMATWSVITDQAKIPREIQEVILSPAGAEEMGHSIREITSSCRNLRTFPAGPTSRRRRRDSR
jgi:methyl-accepting chemotaxis protein